MTIKNTVMQEGSDREMIITRILDAPRDLVFRAWTRPEHVALWWGPLALTNPRCEVDARPGGKIHIDMTAEDGTVYPCIGSFSEVVAPEKLVFTIGTGETEAESKLIVHYVVTLEEQGTKTKLTITGRILKADSDMSSSLAGMEQGLTEGFDKLDQTVSRSEPLVKERIYNAPIDKVWKAITDKAEMKKWYMDFDQFKPEVGHEFEFTAGKANEKFVHKCRVTEVVPGRKISYTWRYEGYSGDSEVTWELFPEGDKTKLILTHRGLETFPADKPQMEKHNFVRGWTYFVDGTLRNYLEK